MINFFSYTLYIVCIYFPYIWQTFSLYTFIIFICFAKILKNVLCKVFFEIYIYNILKYKRKRKKRKTNGSYVPHAGSAHLGRRLTRARPMSCVKRDIRTPIGHFSFFFGLRKFSLSCVHSKLNPAAYMAEQWGHDQGRSQDLSIWAAS